MASAWAAWPERPGWAARGRPGSPARAFWQACRHAVGQFLAGCASGLELAAAGYAADVIIAAEHDTQDTVPLLTVPAFTASAV